MAKEQVMIESFGDDHNTAGAPPDPSSDDVVKEFKAFADEIIHLPIVEAYAALQTEKSIVILAKIKVRSSDPERPGAEDIKGIFIIILDYSKDVVFTDRNERGKWLSRIYAKAKELLPETRKLENPDEFMPEMNKIRAIVPLDGARVIIQIAPNGRAIHKMKVQDLSLAYHNRFTKDVNDKRVIHLDEYWLNSQARPRYNNSTFNPNPNVKLSVDTFNW
jgi:phage anti-repressor protein